MYFPLFFSSAPTPSTSNWSDYSKQHVLNWLFRGIAWPMPSTLAIALCTAVPEPSDTGATIPELPHTNGYERAEYAPGGTRWAATTTWPSTASSGSTHNRLDIDFPQATADWPRVVAAAILDSPTYGEGNLLFYASLTNPASCDINDTFRFAPNNARVALTQQLAPPVFISAVQDLTLLPDIYSTLTFDVPSYAVTMRIERGQRHDFAINPVIFDAPDLSGVYSDDNEGGGAPYQFRVAAVDLQGNQSPWTFGVGVLTTVTGFTAQVVGADVQLSWDAVYGFGTDLSSPTVNLFRNGTQLNVTPIYRSTTSYTDTAPGSGTWTYAIVAQFPQYNDSQPSTATVTI